MACILAVKMMESLLPEQAIGLVCTFYHLKFYTNFISDFEVNIYNARYRPEIGFGKKHIVQHQPIGYRLNCSNSPDTVFVEVRFQGTVVNITDAILANNCKLPTFNNLF